MDVIPFAFIAHYAGPVGVILFAILMALIIYRNAIKDYFQEQKPITEETDPKKIIRATLKKAVRQQKMIQPRDCVQRMLSDLIEIRYRVFSEHLDSVDKWDVSSIKTFGLYASVLSVVYDAIQDAEREATEEGIHIVVITTVRMLTMGSANAFMASVKAICESTAIPTNNLKMKLIYKVLNEVIKEVGSRAEELLAHFDHELDGFEYKGFICGNQSAKNARM